MDPLIFFIFTSEDVYPFVFDRHSKMSGCVSEIHLKRGYFELLLFQLYVKTTSCSIWCLFVCNHHYLSIICRTNASYIDVNAPDFCDNDRHEFSSRAGNINSYFPWLNRRVNVVEVYFCLRHRQRNRKYRTEENVCVRYSKVEKKKKKNKKLTPH